MLTQEEGIVQAFAISAFQAKLGDRKATGHFMDLSCEDDDWWFYEECEDGEIMCYPVVKADMQDDMDNPDFNYGILVI